MSKTVVMAPLDLDKELGRLYGAQLEAFAAERTGLVRALRKEGRRAEAAGVRELRKPSLTVWTVNQLARRHRKDVDLLLDAGHRLVAAQVALLKGGDPKPFEEARRKEQGALKRLHKAAGSILGDRATPGTLERVVTTLRSAAVAPDARERLARGNLTDEVAPAGFDVFAGLDLPTMGSAPPSRSRQARKSRRAEGDDRAGEKAARREAIATARENLKKATDNEAALAKQLRLVEQEVGRARSDLDSAEQEMVRVQTDREAAGRAVDAARSDLERLRAASS